eukprot:XP_001703165.1 predicted protein [Chlamydomonas reinhardtii]
MAGGSVNGRITTSTTGSAVSHIDNNRATSSTSSPSVSSPTRTGTLGSASRGGERAQQVVAFWEDLRANPGDWWDNREDKASGRGNPNIPDFRNKMDRGKAVWIVDRCAPAWVREWLQQHPPGSLASSTAGAAQGGTQAQASSADEALWEDLQANPEKWWEQCMMAVK